MLMVFFSSRISPLTSTVIFFERSPLATVPITWAVSLVGWTRSSIRAFTEAIEAFQDPATRHCPPQGSLARWPILPFPNNCLHNPAYTA